MKFPKLSKALLGGFTAAAMAAGSFSAQAGERLSHAVPDWTGGAVICQLIKTILENEYDYKVKSITMPSGAAVYEGIASGDLDFGCESWPSYSTEKEVMITEFGGDGSVQYMGPTGVVGWSTYYVPRYFIEEVAPDLKRVDQLNE